MKNCLLFKSCVDGNIIDILKNHKELSIREIWKKLKERKVKISEAGLNFKLKRWEEKGILTSKKERFKKTNLLTRLYKLK